MEDWEGRMEDRGGERGHREGRMAPTTLCTRTCAPVSLQVSEARIPDYLGVFYLLHLSGIREHAGVGGTGTAAAAP